MAQSHSPAPIDPDSVKQAQAMWHNFTAVAKWAVIASAVTLLLMAVFLT